MRFSSCEVPLDDWTNSGSADVILAYGEYGDLRTRLCCIASGK